MIGTHWCGSCFLSQNWMTLNRNFDCKFNSDARMINRIERDVHLNRKTERKNMVNKQWENEKVD